MKLSTSNILEKALGTLIGYILMSLASLLGIVTASCFLAQKVHEILCKYPKMQVLIIGGGSLLILVLTWTLLYIYYTKLRLKKLKIGLLADKEGNLHCSSCKSLLHDGKENGMEGFRCPAHPKIIYGRHPADGHDMGYREATEWINENFRINKFERINIKLDTIINFLKPK